ncbi:capsid [uncultured virus]|uniref:Capsid n=1 Tax=uncultured virus TaxID=340016 RepID=A0A2K9LRV7_9VIRU|nr:capsid [uncultured virus]
MLPSNTYLPLREYLNLKKSTYFPPQKNDYTSDYWKNKVALTNQLIHSHPEIHRRFSLWYTQFKSKYQKTPEPPVVIDKVEQFIKSEEKMAKRAWQTSFAKSDPYGGISDAEAAAAADAYESALKRKRINIVTRRPAPYVPYAKNVVTKRITKGNDAAIVTGTIPLTTNDNTGIQVLNLVPPGTGSFQRNGRAIGLDNVRLKLQTRVECAPEAVTGDYYGISVRHVLVWDKQPSGAAIPNFSTIFGLTTQNGVESSSWNAPVSYDSMERFKILKEVCHDFNPGVLANLPPESAGTSNKFQMVAEDDIFYKFKEGKYITNFGGQAVTATIADINTGALYLVSRAYTATSTGSTSANLSNTSFCRFRYHDLN